MKKLICDLKQDNSVEKITAVRDGKSINVGLINQFKIHKFIPNKWFDWKRRVDSPICIIGQDWGPYSVLYKFIQDYEISKSSMLFSYDEFLFKTFSSRTEKLILKTIEKTYIEKYRTVFKKEYWNLFFFTMAVLFTRKGCKFRGSENFNESYSFELSYPYVSRQLDIVKPKIVIPLGNLAIRVVDGHYNLGLGKVKVTELVNKLKPKGYIKKGEVIIIPNFHPAAHIDPKIQLNIWSKVWDFIDIENVYRY